MSRNGTFQLGILGENISYSLSPVIFEWAFAQTGVNGDYRIYDIPADGVSALLQDPNTQWNGLNVTTPHKLAAAACCKYLSENARRAGAVNTIARADGILSGYNTDVNGFRFALQQLIGDRSPRAILVIGSGGAARAVIAVLRSDYPEAQLTVASADPKRAALSFADRGITECLTYSEATGTLAKYDLVAQCTPVGSVKMPGCPLPGKLTFDPMATVFDLVYAPRETELLAIAGTQVVRSRNGLVMLIAQAAASFELWTNKRFPIEGGR